MPKLKPTHHTAVTRAVPNTIIYGQDLPFHRIVYYNIIYLLYAPSYLLSQAVILFIKQRFLCDIPAEQVYII